MNIYVSNLPHAATEHEVRALFTPYGTVESVYVVKDAQTGMSQGSAYVVMPADDEAEHAIASLHGMEYEGYVLQISQADSADFPTGDYW